MFKIVMVLIMVVGLEARWSEKTIQRYKLSVETICKNGYLTDKITGKMDGVKITYEHSHCVDVSSWDKVQCNHLPIKCERDVMCTLSSGESS